MGVCCSNRANNNSNNTNVDDEHDDNDDDDDDNVQMLKDSFKKQGGGCGGGNGDGGTSVASTVDATTTTTATSTTMTLGRKFGTNVEFILKHCSTAQPTMTSAGRYCKYEKLKMTIIRNSNSFVHLSATNFNCCDGMDKVNNVVAIRRTKSSTGILCSGGSSSTSSSSSSGISSSSSNCISDGNGGGNVHVAALPCKPDYGTGNNGHCAPSDTEMANVKTDLIEHLNVVESVCLAERKNTSTTTSTNNNNPNISSSSNSSSISVNTEAKTFKEDLSQPTKGKNLRNSTARVDLVSFNEISLENVIHVNDDERWGEKKGGGDGAGSNSLSTLSVGKNISTHHTTTTTSECTMAANTKRKSQLNGFSSTALKITNDDNAAGKTTANAPIILSRGDTRKCTNPFLDSDTRFLNECDGMAPNENDSLTETTIMAHQQLPENMPGLIGNEAVSFQHGRSLSLCENGNDTSFITDDELCKSELVNNTQDVRCGNAGKSGAVAENHTSSSSLRYSVNDLDRKSKAKHRKYKSRDSQMTQLRLSAQSAMTSENQENEKLDKFINEFNRILSTEHTNQNSVYSIKDIGGLPTCPFQRQDYHKPVDNDEDDNVDVDDVLADNTNTVNNSREHTKKTSTKKDLFGFVTSWHNTIGGKEKLCTPTRNRIPHIKKLNISYPNKTVKQQQQLTDTHCTNSITTTAIATGISSRYTKTIVAGDNNETNGPKDDSTKKNFKRSLIKIGQKCGIKITTKSPSSEKRCTPMSSAECNNHNNVGLLRREKNAIATMSSGSGVDCGVGGAAMQQQYTDNGKAAYKSYKSEIDLTKNLQYLDAFLNENFDKISHVKGSQSIGKMTTARNKKRSSSGLGAGHKRARSCSKNINYANKDYVNLNIPPTHDALKISNISSSPCRLPLTADYYAADAVTGKHSIAKVSGHHKAHVTATAMPNAPRNISSSDSFSTYNSKKSKKPVETNYQFNADLFNCDKSNTTSSSLSSDYASVYSPSTSHRPIVEHSPSTADHASPKRGRHIAARHLTAYTDDFRSPHSNKYSLENDFEQSHNLIQSPRTNHYSSSMHGKQSVYPTSADNVVDTSLYQYENQMPYHEDYLQHYHNSTAASNGSAKLTASAYDYPNVVMTNGKSSGSFMMPKTTSISPVTSHTNYNSSSGSGSSTYTHRVIVSKSKKQTGEIVLEYEC